MSRATLTTTRQALPRLLAVKNREVRHSLGIGGDLHLGGTLDSLPETSGRLGESLLEWHGNDRPPSLGPRVEDPPRLPARAWFVRKVVHEGERPPRIIKGRRGNDPHRGSAQSGVVGVLVAPVAAAIGAVAALAADYSIEAER